MVPTSVAVVCCPYSDSDKGELKINADANQCLIMAGKPLLGTFNNQRLSINEYNISENTMQAKNSGGAAGVRLSRIERRPTLRNAIITQVREAIACGELKAGERITELGLAKSLGVAQATIREAFIELESQGFLERKSARVTRVSALTAKQISEIHLVRSRLESLAVEILTNMPDKDLAAAAEACDGMLSSARENDRTGFYHNDLKFHRSLWLATDNRYLAATLELLTAKLFAFGLTRRAEQSRERLIKTAEEHRRLLDLIASNQGTAALNLLETSLKRAWTEDLQFRER